LGRSSRRYSHWRSVLRRSRRSYGFDLIKLGWNFVNFLTNGEFRKPLLVGAAIVAFISAINFGAIGVAVGVIFAWTLQTLMLALIVVGVMAGGITLMYRSLATPFISTRCGIPRHPIVVIKVLLAHSPPLIPPPVPP
jgi:hypothetical protein